MITYNVSWYWFRTDFFLECPPEGGSYGFPAGYANQMLLEKAEKWKSYSRKKLPSTQTTSNISSNTTDCHGRVPEFNAAANDKQRDSPQEYRMESLTLTSTSPQAQKPKTTNCSSSDSYNGNTSKNYSWSQSITDLDVRIPVATSVVKGKQVQVKIEADSIKVIVEGAEPVEGKLTYPVRKEECYWNLVPGESVNVWLQKSKERYKIIFMTDCNFVLLKQ